MKSSKKCSSCLPGKFGNCGNQDLGGPTSEVTLSASDNSVLTVRSIGGTSSQTSQTSDSSQTSNEVSFDDDENDSQTRDGTSHPLPAFEPSQKANFKWGERPTEEVLTVINNTYDEIVHWKRNLFKVPSGRHGKSFVVELARLFQAYADQSALETVALKAAMILPSLILQKPFQTSKSKDHVACVERRLKLWWEGKFEALVKEGRTIQSRLSRSQSRRCEVNIARRFGDLMMKGKLREATRLLSDESGKVLQLDSYVEDNKCVRDVLRDKHPDAHPLDPSTIASPVDDTFHPVIFEENHRFNNPECSPTYGRQCRTIWIGFLCLETIVWILPKSVDRPV